MSDLGNKEVMAENLRYYVERSGKTQKDMAEILGVSTSTFNDWMLGKKYPRIDKIEMMANYFKIMKSDLIEKRWGMQEKNSTIADAVVRMRSDDEFFSVVGGLLALDADKLSAVKNLLSVLQ
jgi:repressor LexA